MTDPTIQSICKPQPGAVPGKFVANGLPAKDVSNPNDPTWPILPASQAPNFVSAKPMLIVFGLDKKTSKPTDMLSLLPFRVWGEPAWDIGRYWLMGAPDSEADFYGKAAVQYGWNSGRYLCELNNPGAALTAKAWSGGVARQPATSVDAHGKPGPVIEGYHLPGGWTQVYVPDGTLPYLVNQRARWNPLDAPAKASAPAPVAAPLVAESHAGEVGRLFEAAQRLSGLIRALDRQTGRDGESQADALDRRMAALAEDLAKAGSDPDARRRAGLGLWSLVATGRQIDRDLSWSDQAQAVEAALDEIVVAAYNIAQTLA